MSATAQIRRSEVQHNVTSLSLAQILSCWGFLISLLFGPICFGATEPWSLFLLQSCGVGVLVLWVASAPAPLTVAVDLPTMALVIFGFVAIGELLLNTSTYRYVTEQELLKLAIYFVFFFLARHILRTHLTRKTFSQVLAGFGGIFALFATVQRFHGNGRIYWLRATETQAFFGSYANKNHYAGLMEMLLPLALLISANRREETSKRAFFAFAASLMVASVVLSGSRSGIVTILFEVGLFSAVTLLMSPRRRFASARSTLILCLAVALVIWISGEAIVNLTSLWHGPTTDPSFSNRVQILHDSLQLIRERPLFGWGLGAFSTVYPQVQSWYSDLFVNAAHNDYLQLLVETGIAGFAVMMLFLSLVLKAGVKRALQASQSAGFAALIGCIGMLLHSFTDFNMHVPANAALFFALCGLILAASDESFPSPRE